LLLPSTKRKKQNHGCWAKKEQKKNEKKRKKKEELLAMNVPVTPCRVQPCLLQNSSSARPSLSTTPCILQRRLSAQSVPPSPSHLASHAVPNSARCLAVSKEKESKRKRSNDENEKWNKRSHAWAGKKKN
jgi:hypothetical protein